MRAKRRPGGGPCCGRSCLPAGLTASQQPLPDLFLSPCHASPCLEGRQLLLDPVEGTPDRQVDLVGAVLDGEATDQLVVDDGLDLDVLGA